MDDCRYCKGFGYLKPDPFNEHFEPCPKCNAESIPKTPAEIEEELFDDDIGLKISHC